MSSLPADSGNQEIQGETGLRRNCVNSPGRVHGRISIGAHVVYDEDTVQEVWEKGTETKKNDGSRWRKDACGAWMGRQEYLNRDSQYGWEIDRIDPAAGDDLQNLRPLQWQNKACKDHSPGDCAVTAAGRANREVSSP